jgi:hypothetical protein
MLEPAVTSQLTDVAKTALVQWLWRLDAHQAVSLVTEGACVGLDRLAPGMATANSATGFRAACEDAISALMRRYPGSARWRTPIARLKRRLAQDLADKVTGPLHPDISGDVAERLVATPEMAVEVAGVLEALQISELVRRFEEQVPADEDVCVARLLGEQFGWGVRVDESARPPMQYGVMEGEASFVSIIRRCDGPLRYHGVRMLDPVWCDLRLGKDGEGEGFLYWGLERHQYAAALTLSGLVYRLSLMGGTDSAVQVRLQNQ